MKKPDPAHAATDKTIKEIEKRLTAQYEQATKEVQEKLYDYLRRFRKKDATKLRQLREGKITKEEYLQWRKGQIIMGKRWEQLRDQLAEDLTNTDKIARGIIDGYKAGIYAENHNYATYEVEHGAGIDTSYTLYNSEAVERILRENPEMLPPPGKKVSAAIAEGKAVRWNAAHLQNAMLQGILQGESIPALATRVALAVGESNRKSAIRNARTMATGAQNAGRIDAYKRAQAKGVNLRQTWVATLDLRTRHEHRQLDGQTVDVGTPFTVDGEKIRYPGDPNAPGYLVYNCFLGETNAAVDSDIVRSYKHRYKGDLITVKTSGGVNFTCTPNHPILTPSGWTPAALLNQGDDLFVTRIGDKNGFRRNRNINHVHSSMETIHDSLKSAGSVSRDSPLCIDFHGDIPTGDVEIVAKKRELRNDGDSGGRKSVNEILFMRTNKSLFGKSTFMKHFRCVFRASLSLVCRFGKAFSFVKRSLCHSDKHSFRTISGRDIFVAKNAINHLSTDTIFRSKHFDGFSGEILTDNIVSIDIYSGCSHVYNLQTENGYYFVNTIIPHGMDNGNLYAIAKNCRCTVIGQVKGVEIDVTKTDIRSKAALKGMTYDEWKAEKKSEANPIDLPEQKAKTMKRMYISSYKR